MKNLMNTALVNKILIENDIFGYADYESLPIDKSFSTKPNDFCNVVKLFPITNIRILEEEAIDHIQHLEKNYFKERIKNLPMNITPEIMREVLTEVGFTVGTYQGYGLRIPGTSNLLPFLNVNTKQLIENFPTRTFRHQYAVAFEGWNTKFHIDHTTYDTHGYRCMIPINSPVHIVFKENNKDILYCLEPGFSYFVNIANMHRAFHPYKNPRINLSFQMNSAKLIKSVNKLNPVEWNFTEEKYKNFNLVSQVMY